MDEPLSAVDVRVLGALIEKEKSTPDYYPLSLNALLHACNQSSNREPVVQYDESTIEQSLVQLRRRGLVRAIKRVDSRVTKYQHLADEVFGLEGAPLALLCTLLLRGPQTLAELKSRSARLVTGEVEDAEALLQRMMEREPTPLVTRLPRRPGQKETRYAQLLGGPVTFETPDADAVVPQQPTDRVAALETALDEVRREVADLRTQLDAFRRQFE